MNKILVSLLCTTALFSSITPAWGQEKVPPQITFSCEKRQGVSTTVAKNINGELQPLFHWKHDVFPDGKVLQALCKTASTKLNKYFAQGNDPHLFQLLITVQSPFFANYYAVCLRKNDNDNDCNIILFPIVITTNTNRERTTTNYGKALVTLNKVLDPKLKNIKRIDSPDRDALFPRLYIEINLFNNQKTKQQ